MRGNLSNPRELKADPSKNIELGSFLCIFTKTQRNDDPNEPLEKEIVAYLYIVSKKTLHGGSRTDLWYDTGVPDRIKEFIMAHPPKCDEPHKRDYVIASVGIFELYSVENTLPGGEYYYDFEEKEIFVQPRTDDFSN